MLLEEKEYED